MDEEKISIDFSGWAVLDAADVTFVKISDQSTITGSEWLRLTTEERSEHAIQSMVDVVSSNEAVWEEIDITEGNIG